MSSSDKARYQKKMKMLRRVMDNMLILHTMKQGSILKLKQTDIKELTRLSDELVNTGKVFE